MPKKLTPPSPAATDPAAYQHQDKRTYIPSETEAGAEQLNPKVQAHTLRELDKNPIVHRGQDPELHWLGKHAHEGDNQPDYLKLDIRSLYRHEHIRPQELMARLYRERLAQANAQLGLFGQDYQTVDELDKPLSYYQHHAAWENRLILGDSLAVMTSLLEREGLNQKVQMVYLDPPYGIKYGSNWQIRIKDRDVKDGKDEHLSSEPEQIKAFRDTWELGIHSYLSYLRDRLLVSRELLLESGSCFVQISDENVHLVRGLMDEVFGSTNFCSLISVKKTGGFGASLLLTTQDYIIWYAKNREAVKYRQLFSDKVELASQDGHYLRDENNDLYTLSDLTGQNNNVASCLFTYKLNEQLFSLPRGRQWKTTMPGLNALVKKIALPSLGSLSAIRDILRIFLLCLLPMLGMI